MTRSEATALSELDASGWTIVRGARRPDELYALAADLEPEVAATPLSDGPFYGSGTRRFGRLLSRSDVMERIVLDAAILGLVRATVGRQHASFGLNLTQLIAVEPGAGAQVPHRDDAMWPIPDPKGEHLVNVIWPLVPFRAENGATRVWSGSHRGSSVPQEAEAAVAAMAVGDALVVLGSTLHAQGANRSSGRRTAIVVGYQAAWLLPSENPWLSYPPEEAAGFSPELRELLGYRRLPPNLNGVDCRCPSELFGVRGRGATDELSDGQREAIERFAAVRDPVVPPFVRDIHTV